MNRVRPPSGWRASALAAALFAVTLNFLQPLAHAALLRDGAPATLWSIFCSAAAAADPGAHGNAPASSRQTADKSHECCLGLAHASAAIAPPTAFVAVEGAATTLAPSLPAGRPTPVGIRDGPYRPRGPPSFA